MDAGLPPEQILNQGLIAGMSEVGRLFEFEVIDLGTDISPDKFVAAVKQHQPNLVGLSALLTTTMPKMKAAVEALQESGLRPGVKVMIGGAPVTDKYAGDIGADIYAPDASSAATRARQAMA